MAKDTPEIILGEGRRYSEEDVRLLYFILSDVAKVHQIMPVVALVDGLEELLKAIEAKKKKKQ